MLALFDHKIWHSGELVAEGQKHVLRSDIIFMNLNPPEIQRERSFQYAHDGYIWCLHQLKNGLIASGGRDSAIRLWNSEGEMVACLNGHYKSVLGLDSSHEILVSVSRDEKICLWNLKTLTLEQKLPSITVSFSTQAAAILCVLVLPDGSFVTGGANHKIQKWSCEGQQQGTLIGHEGWVWDIKQIDQNRIVSVSEDGSLCLWSLEAIHELKDRVRGTDPMTALDVCPRSKTVVVGDNKGLVSLWTVSDAQRFELRGKYQIHTSIIRCLKLIPDKQILMSGGEDMKTIVSSLTDLTPQAIFPSGNFVTDLLRISEDMVLSTSYDGSIVPIKI